MCIQARTVALDTWLTVCRTITLVNLPLAASTSHATCFIIELALIRFSLQRSQARGVRLCFLGGVPILAKGIELLRLSCRGLLVILGGI